MFRLILPDGDITCAAYERVDEGVEAYTEDDALIAFVPYANLVALVDEDVQRSEDRSVM